MGIEMVRNGAGTEMAGVERSWSRRGDIGVESWGLPRDEGIVTVGDGRGCRDRCNWY